MTDLDKWITEHADQFFDCDIMRAHSFNAIKRGSIKSALKDFLREAYERGYEEGQHDAGRDLIEEGRP